MVVPIGEATKAKVTDPRTPVQVSAFIAPSLKKSLEALADRNDRSLSAEIRLALTKHLLDG